MTQEQEKREDARKEAVRIANIKFIIKCGLETRGYKDTYLTQVKGYNVFVEPENMFIYHPAKFFLDAAWWLVFEHKYSIEKIKEKLLWFETFMQKELAARSTSDWPNDWLNLNKEYGAHPLYDADLFQRYAAMFYAPAYTVKQEKAYYPIVLPVGVAVLEFLEYYGSVQTDV